MVPVVKNTPANTKCGVGGRLGGALKAVPAHYLSSSLDALVSDSGSVIRKDEVKGKRCLHMFERVLAAYA